MGVPLTFELIKHQNKISSPLHSFISTSPPISMEVASQEAPLWLVRHLRNTLVLRCQNYDALTGIDQEKNHDMQNDEGAWCT